MSESSDIQYLYRYEKFWLENPGSLFNSVNPFPDRAMTKNQRLNALTRFVLLVTLFLVIADFKLWPFFLLISLLIIILIYLFTPQDSQNILIENYTCKRGNKKDRHVTFLPEPEIRFFTEYDEEETIHEQEQVHDSGFIAYD